MKIAVPTIGDQVDQHFGHCEKYTAFTIENQAIAAEEYMASPAGCGDICHEHGPGHVCQHP